MNKSTLALLLMVASLATFAGTATLAQQAGGAPQPQLNTPGRTPPAEITPPHPLNGTTEQRARSNTTGSAPRTQGGGESQGNHATDKEKK
jgi:hypothetical protein